MRPPAHPASGGDPHTAHFHVPFEQTEQTPGGQSTAPVQLDAGAGLATPLLGALGPWFEPSVLGAPLGVPFGAPVFSVSVLGGVSGPPTHPPSTPKKARLAVSFARRRGALFMRNGSATRVPRRSGGNPPCFHGSLRQIEPGSGHSRHAVFRPRLTRAKVLTGRCFKVREGRLSSTAAPLVDSSGWRDFAEPAEASALEEAKARYKASLTPWFDCQLECMPPPP
jgi:hypothetical protein